MPRSQEYDVGPEGGREITREELEERKREVFKRLGLTLDSDNARTAHQYAGKRA
jgi:hypothetical protein